MNFHQEGCGKMVFSENIRVSGQEDERSVQRKEAEGIGTLVDGRDFHKTQDLGG